MVQAKKTFSFFRTSPILPGRNSIKLSKAAKVSSRLEMSQLPLLRKKTLLANLKGNSADAAVDFSKEKVGGINSSGRAREEIVLYPWARVRC